MPNQAQEPDFHEPDLEDFLTFLDQAECDGIRVGHDGDTNASFVPFDELEKHLKAPLRVQRLLEGTFRKSPSTDIPPWVPADYYRIFAILLRIAKGTYLGHFIKHRLTDARLPFERTPAQFPRSSIDLHFFQKFWKAQWAFCAPDFKYGHLSSTLFQNGGWILPITEKKEIGSGGSARVYRIKLHESYDHLRQPPRHHFGSRRSTTTTLSHTYVIKTYRGREGSEFFRKETEAFAHLANGAQPHRDIVAYYGSFKIREDYNIILEYADKRHLDEYFRTTPPPGVGQDIVHFWECLFRLIYGLVQIHNAGSRESNDLTNLIGFHEDLKPANILVMSGGARSPYQYQFKIADLGTTHFKKVKKNGERADIATHGTLSYGAPECHRPDEVLLRGNLYVLQSCDIWSLGCIFSEALVWMGLGWGGLVNYRRDRRREARRSHITAGDCFHNGQNLLSTVKGMHARLKEQLADDLVSNEVLDMIQDMLAIKATSRPSAQELTRRPYPIINNAKDNLTIFTTQDSSGDSSCSRPQTPPEVPPEFEQSITPTRATGRTKESLPSSPTDESEYSRASPIRPSPLFAQSKSKRSRTESSLPKSPQNSRRPAVVAHHTSPPGLSSDRVMKPRNRRPRRQRANAVQDEVLEAIKTSVGEQNVLRQASRPPRKTASSGYRPQSRISGAQSGNSKIIKTEMAMQGLPAQNLIEKQEPTPVLNVPDVLLTPHPHENPNQSESRTQPTLSESSISGFHGPGTDILSSIRKVSIDSSESGEELPYCSFKDAMEWVRARRTREHSTLPSEHLLSYLRDRDHVFVVDNSSSMERHRTKVASLFGTLSYMVKPTDPDGLDLFFSMDHKTVGPVHNKRTRHLVREVDRKKFEGNVDITRKLRKILEDYEDRLDAGRGQAKAWRRFFKSASRLRPMTVYVFTDGAWNPNHNPDQLFAAVEDTLARVKAKRGQLRIQFIRFGEEPKEVQTLRELCYSTRDGQRTKRNFVDVEPYKKGNIWKMLLGSGTEILQTITGRTLKSTTLHSFDSERVSPSAVPNSVVPERFFPEHLRQ